MFPRRASFSSPVCTVRRHPEGGYSPVLHLSDHATPPPDPEAISLPTVDDAQRYARDHYGTRVIVVDPECWTARVA